VSASPPGCAPHIGGDRAGKLEMPALLPCYKVGGVRMAEVHVVLLVDGDAAAREFAARALREHGFLVAHAPTAESALELMRHVIVDVLFTDVAMLAAGGRELVEAARRGNPATRVICASGFARDAADAAALRICQRLLRKPYAADELRSEIRRLLVA
jgi:two-component system, cell cycle sensor histidine kinase and response regulator CckA